MFSVPEFRILELYSSICDSDGFVPLSDTFLMVQFLAASQENLYYLFDIFFLFRLSPFLELNSSNMFKLLLSHYKVAIHGNRDCIFNDILYSVALISFTGLQVFSNTLSISPDDFFTV